jgi:LCP family protein required for cell wall assembly
MSNLVLILFLAFMLPVFLCGMGFVVYLVFPPAPLDVVVLGLDARPGEGYATRTDSIMIVGLLPSRLRVSMLSIPRDLFIDVPGYGAQRINTVNVLGEIDMPGSGPALLAQGIQNSFGIQPDRYVRMNFQGFTELIDAVGGVTIDVDRTIIDNAYPTEDDGTTSIRFDPGVQTMDGERALIYARTRHSDDDYQRAARQQQVLSALSLKLFNPLTWPAVLDTMSRNVDTDLSAWDMVSYAPTVILNAGRFERQVIDRDYIITTADGSAVPNYAALDSWIRERFD